LLQSGGILGFRDGGYLGPATDTGEKDRGAEARETGGRGEERGETILFLFIEKRGKERAKNSASHHLKMEEGGGMGKNC